MPGQPLAAELPPGPGRREARYAHLLCGPVPVEVAQRDIPAEPAVLTVRAEDERIARLEGRVDELAAAVEDLRRQLGEFRRQFE